MALRTNMIRSADRAKTYFANSLAREDYYTRDREIVGVWGGALADRLEISGDVDEETYFQLVDNINPLTGDNLTPKTRADRRVGMDFTFSMPKSLSLHAGLMENEDIERAFDRAVEKTMKGLEQDMQVRVQNGERFAAKNTGELLYASFRHHTSRPIKGAGADPHLHRHVVVFNTTIDHEKSEFRAAEFNQMVLKRAYWEAVFHNNLALEVQAEGYQTVRDAKSAFELKGYGRETTKAFSRRTEQIEEIARELGIVDPKKKAALGAKTRAGKESGLSVADHRESWWERLSDEEREMVDAVEAGRFEKGTEKGEGDYDVSEALEYATQECFARNSVVRRYEFLTAYLKAGMGEFSLEQAEAELERAVEDGRLIGADWEGEACITTEEVQLEEEKMLTWARETQGQFQPLMPAEVPLPESRSDQGRPEDWDAAARAILSSRDRLIMVNGKTGAGKTTVMQTVADGLASQGMSIHAFAPSTMASRENQVKAGFEGAETLAKLFANEKLQEECRGGVIWLDEAGMAGSRETNALFELAEKLDARVIASGDVNQHHSVSRGDAMRILQRYGEIEPVRLNIVRRQSERQYRLAVEDLNEGRIERGFDRLVEMGAVNEIEDHEDRYAKLAADYATHRIDRGKSVVVIAPTHYERKLANENIRYELKTRGVVSAVDEQTIPKWEKAGFLEVQKSDHIYYERGQKVKFHKSSPGITTGTSGTVAEISNGEVWFDTKEGKRIRLPLEQAKRFDVFEETEMKVAVGDQIIITKNGLAKSTTSKGRRQALVNGRSYTLEGFTEEGDLVFNNGLIVESCYANLDYGYGVTSHRSQSLGEDVALVAESESSFAAAGMAQFLVSVSRGKELVRIYTDNEVGLSEAVQRDAVRLSATELLDEALNPQKLDHDGLTVEERAHQTILELSQADEEWETTRENTRGGNAAEIEGDSERSVPGRERER